jgi:hypothetical protein
MQSFHMAVTSIRCINAGKCTDKQAGPFVDFFPKSDQGVVSKMLRKSEVQFNDIFWAIWDLILASIGDLSSIIDSHVKRAEDVDTFADMQLSLAKSIDDKGKYKNERRNILCPQILGLVDQLLCVSVYGNQEMLTKRCPESDRVPMFEQAGTRAFAARNQFLAAWKERIRQKGAETSEKAVNGDNEYGSDRGDEEEEEGGSQVSSGMQDEDCLMGRYGAQLIGDIPTLVADGSDEDSDGDASPSAAGAAGAAAPAAARAAAPSVGADGEEPAAHATVSHVSATVRIMC